MKNSSFLAAASLSFFLFSSVAVFSQDQGETRNEFADKFSSLINRPDVCEAYPYLSADGLRLYFTTNREGGHGRLYLCSRTSISDDFSAPKPLSHNLPDGYYAATLTADELTIYASYEGEIYSSVRSSINDQFVNPTVVEGLANGRKFAPAISQDGNELIIFLDGGWKGRDVAVHYRKNSTGGFIEVNRIKAPVNFDFDPGQFSKDGLSFYASFQMKNELKEPDGEKTVSKPSFIQKIVRFTRESLQDNFTASEEVPELNSSMQNHQPTMNDDETIFIVGNATADSWSKNELRLINFKQQREPEDFKCVIQEEVREFPDMIISDTARTGYHLPKEWLYCPLLSLDSFVFVCDYIYGSPESIDFKIEALPEQTIQAKVYPNPFVNDLNIIISSSDLSPNFDLYDISGRKILSTKLNNVSNRVRFNQPGSGIYIYKITDKTGKLISTGKLVKR